MSKKRHKRISTIGSRVSTVVSVSLVLLIVGLILISSSLTSGASDALRQRVILVVRLTEDINDADCQDIFDRVKAEPYAASVVFISADEVLQEEMADNSEILSVIGENPFSPEIEVFLHPQYVDPDSISGIENSLYAFTGVDEVFTQAEVIKNVNAVLKKATIVLIVLGAALLLISVVLLFNTINLAIYARRFIIRTMQLIGATPSFIRRPFMISGLWIGVCSAILASAMLCGLHFYAMTIDLDNLFFVDWPMTACVCAVLFVVGTLLCCLAAWFATSRYLRASYDALYRK